MCCSFGTVCTSKVIYLDGIQTVYRNCLVFLKACNICIFFSYKQSVPNRLDTFRYYNIQCRINKMLLILRQVLIIRIFIQGSLRCFSLRIRQIRIICLIRIITQL